MRRLHPFLKRIPLYLLLIYLGLCLYLYTMQESLVFFPMRGECGEAATRGTERVVFTVGGVNLRGWLVNGEYAADKLIVYYGGNAEEVCYNIEDFSTRLKAAVLLVNYRGYGESEGSPGEKVLFGDAVEILRRARADYKSGKVILFGRSVGAGVAAYVASREANDGVVLVTPFDSLVEVAREHYPLYPVSLLLRHRFDSMSYAPRIASPVLVLYGTTDRIVSNRRTENLLNCFKTPPEAVRVTGADHNDIAAYPEYWEALEKFMNAL